MKLLSGILSFLGVSSYGQNKLSNYINESSPLEKIAKQEININGGRLILSGQYHGSVGVTYDVECDSTAFVVRREQKYKTPEKVNAGMCGADDSTVVFTLIPQKKGIFEILEVSGFRGNVTKRVKLLVTVK